MPRTDPDQQNDRDALRALRLHHLFQVLRIVGACALSYSGATEFGLPEAYWAAITAVVVTQPDLAATLSSSWQRVAGTLLGALTGFSLILGSRHGWPTHATFWVALLPLAVLTAYRPYMRLGIVTLVVVVLVPSNSLDYSRATDRVLGILVGTVAAIAVSMVLRVSRVKRVIAWILLLKTCRNR